MCSGRSDAGLAAGCRASPPAGLQSLALLGNGGDPRRSASGLLRARPRRRSRGATFVDHPVLAPCARVTACLSRAVAGPRRVATVSPIRWACTQAAPSYVRDKGTRASPDRLGRIESRGGAVGSLWAGLIGHGCLPCPVPDGSPGRGVSSSDDGRPDHDRRAVRDTATIAQLCSGKCQLTWAQRRRGHGRTTDDWTISRPWWPQVRPRANGLEADPWADGCARTDRARAPLALNEPVDARVPLDTRPFTPRKPLSGHAGPVRPLATALPRADPAARDGGCCWRGGLVGHVLSRDTSEADWTTRGPKGRRACTKASEGGVGHGRRRVGRTRNRIRLIVRGRRFLLVAMKTRQRDEGP